jgi:hypothetical protein
VTEAGTPLIWTSFVSKHSTKTSIIQASIQEPPLRLPSRSVSSVCGPFPALLPLAFSFPSFRFPALSVLPPETPRSLHVTHMSGEGGLECCRGGRGEGGGYTSMYTNFQTHTTCARARTHTHTHIYHIYIYMYMCMYITCIYIYIHVHTCMYTRVCVCVCVRASYSRAHTRTHVYTCIMCLCIRAYTLVHPTNPFPLTT